MVQSRFSPKLLPQRISSLLGHQLHCQLSLLVSYSGRMKETLKKKKEGESSFKTTQIFKQGQGQVQYLVLLLPTYPFLLTHFPAYEVTLRNMH